MKNMFFNTHVQGCGPLTDAADFCLAPVRLLWKGKTVTLEGKITDSFPAEARTLPRSILAALVLPICTIVGSILKAFTYLSHDALKAYNQARDILKKYDITHLKDTIQNPNTKQKVGEVNLDFVQFWRQPSAE